MSYTAATYAAATYTTTAAATDSVGAVPAATVVIFAPSAPVAIMQAAIARTADEDPSGIHRVAAIAGIDVIATAVIGAVTITVISAISAITIGVIVITGRGACRQDGHSTADRKRTP
jgi:hypothetical protein